MATVKSGGVSGNIRDRQDALKQALARVERRFGKGAVLRMGDRPRDRIAVIPTGSLGLDIALGIGGYPRGRVVEIFGPESSGKTTLALHAIAEVQKSGGVALFIDAEHAFDPVYARRLGIQEEELLVAQPGYGEEALEIADTMIQSGAVDLVVIDSVAALVPKAELDGGMGEAQVGLQARLMSQALRKLVSTIGQTQCVCIFINQLREKIGVVYGQSETTTGGRALAFYASVRIDIRKVGQIKEGEEVRGIRVRARVVKNKVAPPFRSAEFDILFREGISRLGELLDLGVQYEVVEKSGAWYSFQNTKLGQGRERAREFLRAHPEVAEAIERAIRKKALPEVVASSSEASVPSQSKKQEKAS